MRPAAGLWLAACLAQPLCAESSAFPGASCVAFGLFRQGLYASASADLGKGRDVALSHDAMYQHMVKGLAPAEQAALDLEIDRQGWSWEATYRDLKSRNPGWTGRDNFVVADLCFGYGGLY